MSLRYLFPCPDCSHPIELLTKQAGQSVSCSNCQAKSEAPKLGLLRQLESIQGSETNIKSAAPGGLKNWLFVAGLGIAFIAGIAGGALYFYSTGMISQVDIDGGMELFESEVDKMTDSDVVEFFEEMRVDAGLGEWHEQPVVRYSNQGRILKQLSYVILGICGFGLLVLSGSFLVRS